jgi:hypothetical protein
MTYTKPFEQVWQELPKKMKKGKFQAQKTWQKLNDKGELPETADILSAIRKQKKERAFLRSQNRFVPEWKHFSTWLNAGCVDDEVELAVERTEPKRNNGNGIDNMKRALNILTNISEEKYHEFCKATNMCDNDKEAVWNKFSMAFDVQGLAKGIG